MKQVLIKKGKAFSTEIPDITVASGNILIEVKNSCISVGTELRGVSESGKSLFKKALEKPEKVRQLLGMVQSHGFQYVYNKISEKKFVTMEKSLTFASPIKHEGSAKRG